MQFAELNNVTLHYQLLSAAPGKPVMVFINSLGTDFRIWRDVIVGLAGNVAMIAYDKRGHGLSSIGKSPYKMADHIADLEALLDHLQLKNVILCGVSVGGMIAIGLSSKRPDLVRALVLCDTGHKIGTHEMWNQRIAALETDGIEGMSDAILDRWFTDEFQNSQPAALEGYRNMLVRQTLEGYIGTCTALRDADYTNEARLISVPSLCVVGDQDGSTPPALVEELSQLIAESRFEIIEGAGHIPSIEQPQKLTGLINDFLKDLPVELQSIEGGSAKGTMH